MVVFNVIIHTRTAKVKKYEKKKNSLKEKRAKQCIDCESNKEGFCNKHLKWCSVARLQCEECTETVKDYYWNGSLRVNDKKNKKKKNKAKR